MEVYLRHLIASYGLAESCHVMSPFFWTCLSSPCKTVPWYDRRVHINFRAVRRQTCRVDIFSKDMIIVPMCEDEHWVVAVVRGVAASRRVLDGSWYGRDETSIVVTRSILPSL